MPSYQYDFLVIGAGIVGLAVASELRSRYPGSRIGVLEKESGPGMHASGRNSGVLHSGIYYSSGTLKAQVCSKGAARMREFAAEHGIPCLRSGKIILPTCDQDLASVERLLKNAQDNHIRAERIDEKAIHQIEPNARSCSIGIFSPDTAVIDSKAVTAKLRSLLESHNVSFHWGCKMVRAIPKQDRIVSSLSAFAYGHLYNCAGANADRIARMFGLAKDYALVPFKGTYYKVKSSSSYLVRSNIYPVPDGAFPFLGVHLTRDIHGEVYVGPTAIPAFGRENYGLIQGIRPVEAAAIAWRLVSLYVQNQLNFRALVHTELGKYQKKSFLKAAQQLVPAIQSRDLVPTSKSGIRPQLVNLRQRRLEMDYVLERTTNSTHVLNAISPAFTSAFTFAELVVDASGLGSGRRQS